MILDFSSLYLNVKNIFVPIHFILNAYELEKLWGLYYAGNWVDRAPYTGNDLETSWNLHTDFFKWLFLSFSFPHMVCEDTNKPK